MNGSSSNWLPWRILHRSLRYLSTFVVLVLASQPICGADFVVETRMFDGDGKKPFSRNRTLFYEGQVYDFIVSGKEITVMDKSLGRFVLLDTRRKVKAEVSTDQVLGYTQHIKTWAGSKNDPLLKFYANPTFDVVEKGKTKLLLKAAALSYDVDAQSETTEIVGQYREFSDWFARLNSAVNPGSQLPFPRLALNNHLARRQLVPTTVELTIAPQPRFDNKPIVLRAEHEWRSELSADEISQIEEARRLLVKFKVVPLPEYRKPDLQAGR